MKIFLTGGTGFIGKFVVQKLRSHHRLLILTRNPDKSIYSDNIIFLKGSLESIDKWKNELKKFNPEAAIHLAWESIPDFSAEKCIKNLKYGLDLIQLLKETCCRTILATGSLWEYGNVSGKLSEDLNPQSISAFTAAKNSLNFLGREIAKEKNINFIWTRLFYVYGPDQRKDSIIPYLIKCVKEGEIPLVKNPKAQNDFIYVEDAAEALIRILLKCKQTDIYNIGSGNLTSIQNIIKKIFAICKVEEKFNVVNQNSTDSLSFAYADISKIRKTGWKLKTHINEGLRKTIKLFPYS